MFWYPGEILYNLTRSPRALPGSAFHKSLELDRAMLAGEVNRSLAHTLVASKGGALPHAPAGITAEQIRLSRRIAQGGFSGVMSADAGEDALQLQQAILRIALNLRRFDCGGIGRWWRVSSPSVAARIIDEQTMRARLTARGIPERLYIQIGDDEAVVNARPGATLVPVGR